MLEDRIRAAVPHAAGISTGALKPIPPDIRVALAEMLARAFTQTFWWAVAMTAMAVVPSILLAFRARGRAPSGARARAPPVA